MEENNNKQNIAIAKLEQTVKYLEGTVDRGFAEIKTLIKENKTERQAEILELKSCVQNNRIYGEQRYITQDKFTPYQDFIDKVKDKFIQVALGTFLFLGGIVLAIYYLIRNKIE